MLAELEVFCLYRTQDALNLIKHNRIPLNYLTFTHESLFLHFVFKFILELGDRF